MLRSTILHYDTVPAHIPGVVARSAVTALRFVTKTHQALPGLIVA